jgi:hypothetical protein
MNYVQSTNFATKDALPSGDPQKIVKGTEINTEFVNIATAVSTKQDTVPLVANGVLFSDGSNAITNGTALVFDGSNLGLGVTPSAWSVLRGFDVSTSGGFFGHSAQAGLSNNAFFNGTNWIYKNTAAATFFRATVGSFEWHTAPSGTAGNAISFTQAMTLDASGRLGIGTTSPANPLSVSGSTGTLASFTNGATADFSIICGSSITSLNAGGANILAFQTGGTERARIDSSGQFLVACTSSPGGGTSTTGAAFGPGYVSVQRADATPCFLGRSNDGEVMALYSGTTQRGQVSISGATTTYGSFSDYRLKENIAALTGGLEKVMALKPSTFNFIEFPEQAMNGFIAHEVAEIEPIAVVGAKDATDESGKPAYQSVDPAKLVPLLTAAIQEQQALIQTLTARVAALESN